MEHEKQYKEKFLDFFNLKYMLPLILILLVVLLVSLTWPVWLLIFRKIKLIFLPFILGFLIAYILRPLVVFFEKYKIPRSISISVTFVSFIAIIILLFSMVLPPLLRDLSQLFYALSEGLGQVFDLYASGSNSSLIDSILKQVLENFNALLASMGDLPLIASDFIGSILSSLSFLIFSLVIAIYIIFDYEKISLNIHEKAEALSPKLALSLRVVNEAVSAYLKSFAIIMPIIAIEYALMYFLLGHEYALILGIFTALSLLIPYIGPMLVHGIGITTALGMPRSKLVILLVALVVLSNIDGYVTGPLVYSKRNKVEPLWSLFAFFAASTLFGFVGLLISLPLYLSIRSILQLRKSSWDLKLYEERRNL